MQHVIHRGRRKFQIFKDQCKGLNYEKSINNSCNERKAVEIRQLIEKERKRTE
jgi:hypothetical protein